MRESTNALSHKLEPDKAEHIITRVNTNSSLVDDIVNKLVAEYCGPLDDYMKIIDDILVNQNEPITNEQLDEFTLNLPSLLYFTSESQESLGIREDVCNAIRNEIYNQVREKSTGTVADKDTAAELATQAETIVLVAYRRAYKKVKLRVEAAYEMLGSVKKVMTRRIAEYGLSSADEGKQR